MAFRSMNQWQRIVNGLRGYATSASPNMKLNPLRGYATSTAPKMKAYNPTANFAEQPSSKRRWGEFVPVYVAVGMITIAVTIGLHTAKQQLMHNPHVFVKKERREMLPEVVDPDRVLADANKFMNKTFFRKVAHVQEYNPTNTDPTYGDVYAQRPRAVTLKSVGVDPKEVADPK